jgi:hypothetical protein
VSCSLSPRGKTAPCTLSDLCNLTPVGLCLTGGSGHIGGSTEKRIAPRALGGEGRPVDEGRAGTSSGELRHERQYKGDEQHGGLKGGNG